MTRTPVLAATSALVLACVYTTPAFASDASALQRIAALEARVSALEGRGVSMQAPATSQPQWLDEAKWKQMRAGMTEQEVIELLGPPTGGQRPNFGGASTDTVMFYQAIDSTNLAGAKSGMVSLQRGRVMHWIAPYF